MLKASHQFYAMGSDCAIHIVADTAEDLDRLTAAAEAEVRRIELRYSRYRSDSELLRINAVAAAGGSISIDDETAGLIVFAKACFEKTEGAFDITSGLLRSVWDFSAAQLPNQQAIDALLPRIGFNGVGISNGQLHFAHMGMELDFGGLGKEYAADRAAEVCVDLGAKHGLVDLAGDIRVIGPQPDGQPWRIGIRHPRNPSILIAEITLSGGALATSGDYERYFDVDGRRYCHILDPRNGWPAQGLSSATVISDRCLVAGSLSTSAMLKGESGGAWLASLGVRHIIVDSHGICSGTEAKSIRPYN